MTAKRFSAAIMFILFSICSVCLGGCGGQSNEPAVITEDDSGAADETEKETNQEEAERSYLGAWISDDEKTIFIIEDNGNGSIIKVSKSDQESMEEASKLGASINWQENDKEIVTTSNLGTIKLKKGEDESLSVGSTAFNRMDEELAFQYLKEAGEQAEEAERKNEEQKKETFEETELGSTFENSMIQISFDSIGISHELYPDDTSDLYSYEEARDGYQFVCLRGRIKNVGTEDVDSDFFKCTLTINGDYTYDAAMSLMTDPTTTIDYLLVPFEACTYVIYATLPEEAVSSMIDGNFIVRFNDDLYSRAEPFDHNMRISCESVI